MHDSWLLRLIKQSQASGHDQNDQHGPQQHSPSVNHPEQSYYQPSSFAESIEHMGTTAWRSYHQTHNLYKFLEPDRHKAIIQAKYIDELKAITTQLESEIKSNPALAKAMQNNDFDKAFISAPSWADFVNFVTFPQYPHFKCDPNSSFPIARDQRTGTETQINPKFLNPCDPRIAILLRNGSVFHQAFDKVHEAQKHFVHGIQTILQFFGQSIGEPFNLMNLFSSVAWTKFTDWMFSGPSLLTRGLDAMTQTLET